MLHSWNPRWRWFLAVLAVAPAVVKAQTNPEPASTPPPRKVTFTFAGLVENAERFGKERAVLDGLPTRIDDATRALAKAAVDAEKFLVAEPDVLRMVVDNKPRQTYSRETVPQCHSMDATLERREWFTEDDVKRWSVDLWDSAPLRERWAAIRKLDESGVAQRMALPDKCRPAYDETQAISQQIRADIGMDFLKSMSLEKRNELYERYHQLYEYLSGWSLPAVALVEQFDAFRSDLAVSLSHRQRTVWLLGPPYASGVSDEFIQRPTDPLAPVPPVAEWIRILPGLGLGSDTALAGRHRYAMSDRHYFSDDRKESVYTWPCGERIEQAATDFDFWYRWATDETWYAGGDRKLDQQAWPKDSEKTRALHAEFAKVVRLEHRLLYRYNERDRNMQETETRWHQEKWWEPTRPIEPGFGPDLRRLYFRESRPDDERRIPPVSAPPAGRLLPTTNK